MTTLTERGLERIPDARRQPLPDAVLQAALEQLDANDELAAETTAAFDLTGGSTKSFALDYIGALIKQPRLLGQSDDDYKIALRARILVRQSRGTLGDVKRVVAFISEVWGNGNYVVTSPSPKSLVIGIGSLSTSPAELETIVRLLLDTVGEVDRFDLWAIPFNVFTWDTPGQGWSEGIWAEKVYTTY
jgi:hypothetical protein